MNREERRTGKQERRINHQAPRAAEAAGEDAELARFLVAGDLSIMFHDGKGRSLSVEEKVTILNALCASSRPAIIEECARVPLDPTKEMVEAGAQRLVRWETGKETWPTSWSALDVRASRNDAEKVWRSMWLSALAPGGQNAAPQAGHLRAAPSLSREEWRLIGVAINGYFTGPTSTVELEALRAKVREAGK